MSIEVMVRQMTAGFGQTCLIFFLTLIFSLPLGMIVYFGRVCRFKPLSWLVKIYISIMRGTPLMLQLLIWYFGPFYLWGMNIGGYKFTAIILGCSLNYAQDRSATGGKNRFAICHQRGHHTGQRYLSGIFRILYRDVCRCKTDCCCTDYCSTVLYRRYFLLCI